MRYGRLSVSGTATDPARFIYLSSLYIHRHFTYNIRPSRFKAVCASTIREPALPTRLPLLYSLSWRNFFAIPFSAIAFGLLPSPSTFSSLKRRIPRYGNNICTKRRLVIWHSMASPGEKLQVRTMRGSKSPSRLRKTHRRRVCRMFAQPTRLAKRWTRKKGETSMLSNGLGTTIRRTR